MQPTDPVPGLPTTFGKYELLDKIGTGGMAEIFRARSVGPDGFEKILVIKRVLPELVSNKTFINLLVAEAKVTSLLNHPNIVQIHELGDVDGTYYIAMELVDGADLLNLLSRCTRDRLRVPIEIGLHIVSEVSRGLAHAHAATDRGQRALNIIHRDVSPSNILISKYGDVKIMDFGVARADLGISAPSNEQDRGVLKGKLGYMSPEQVTGRPIDRRSDIFALGVVLFECLTLKRLFVGQTDVQTLLNIREADVEQRFKRHSYLPKPIRGILRKALAKDPDERFQTATDFQEAILDYLFDSRLKVSSRSVAVFLEQVLNAPPNVAPGTLPADAASSSEAPPSIESTDESRADGTAPRIPPPTEPGAPPPLPPPTPGASPPRTRALRRVDLSRATFHFRHDDETVFGPVDFDRVVSLLAERAIGPREWVSINGSDWMRAEDVRAIVDIQPSLFEPEPSRPLDDGPINRYRLPALFFRIAQSRLTGKLKLSAGTVQKELYFDKGELRYAHSNLKSDLFGSFLVQQGLVEPAHIERALERVAGPQSHLGHALTELGILSATALTDALNDHLRSRALEILSWRDGWFEFFEGMLAPRDIEGRAGDLAALTMDGIRHYYNLGDLRRLFDGLLHHSLIVGRDTGPISQKLQLQSDEERVRPALRSNVTLQSLLDAAAASEATQLYILRIAFALHQTDHLALRAPRP